MPGLLRVANLVLLVVNIALFVLWFSMIKRDSLPSGGEAATCVLSELTLMVAVLEIVIALGAVLLAGLGFFGFQVMLERADQAARETATALLRGESEAPAEPARRTSGSLPNVGRVTPETDRK